VKVAASKTEVVSAVTTGTKMATWVGTEQEEPMQIVALMGPAVVGGVVIVQMRADKETTDGVQTASLVRVTVGVVEKP